MISETASALYNYCQDRSGVSSLLALLERSSPGVAGRRHNFWQWLHAWHRQGVGGVGTAGAAVSHTYTYSRGGGTACRCGAPEASERALRAVCVRHAKAIDAPMRVHDARPHRHGHVGLSAAHRLTWHGCGWILRRPVLSLPARIPRRCLWAVTQIVTARGKP